MRTSWKYTAVLALALSLAGCGGDDATAPQVPEGINGRWTGIADFGNARTVILNLAQDGVVVSGTIAVSGINERGAPFEGKTDGNRLQWAAQDTCAGGSQSYSGSFTISEGVQGLTMTGPIRLDATCASLRGTFQGILSVRR